MADDDTGLVQGTLGQRLKRCLERTISSLENINESDDVMEDEDNIIS